MLCGLPTFSILYHCKKREVKKCSYEFRKLLTGQRHRNAQWILERKFLTNVHLHKKRWKKKLHGLSPRANYTDQQKKKKEEEEEEEEMKDNIKKDFDKGEKER
jgi:hypothetical protein